MFLKIEGISSGNNFSDRSLISDHPLTLCLLLRAKEKARVLIPKCIYMCARLHIDPIPTRSTHASRSVL